MSDAMANNTATPRSARAAALERRRALSQNGRAALGAKASQPARPAAKPAVAATVTVTAAAPERVNPVQAAPAAPTAATASMTTSASGKSLSGKSLSRARREALSQGGKAALGQTRTAARAPNPVPAAVVQATIETVEPSSGCGCGCKGKDKTEAVEYEQTIEAVCEIVDNEPAAVSGPVASAVRQLCQERRRALSSQGKAAARFTKMKAATAGLTGRAAAQARRAELCENGRGNDPACRPTGRVRSRTAPIKVEIGTTLSGTPVSGTQVERTSKITGVETGSCRAITGTEYIGAEQYEQLCSTMPSAAPAKVSVSNTSRGQRVSGVDVDLSAKMTGGDSGACQTVTGTEYLSADKFESFCAAKPTLAPAKVGLAVTRAGLTVSGTEETRSVKVTGDETGACNSKLTGSQYAQDQSASACRNGSSAPHKVSLMSTSKNRNVTGTDVAPGSQVTGGERGACADVTGTESNGLAQYQACNREPAQTPEKVGVMRTWRGQQVSGTAVEHSTKVTGDEYGGCQQISGTEYIGQDQYVAFCDAERQAASRALISSRGARASMPLRGDSGGSNDKVTGTARGENPLLSGTPYFGMHQRVSQRGANFNPHPLSRNPYDAPCEEAPAPLTERVTRDFSVATPARSAQGSSLNRVTGTAYGAIGRITGPINMAAGLVSGTPEFRYQEDVAPVVMVQAPAVEEMRSRLTGDGREGGFAITGAAWRRNESVTGTEGSSTRRNPTMRGDQRGAMVGASQMKDRERPELPVSRITGSSGNDSKGSAITYSGGARG